MANTYFQFKQFTVHQEKCAMKVTTDACLFGAIAAALSLNMKPTMKVLDIGTGTGLLSLMFAQINVLANLDAVEIDAQAFEQAHKNFTVSPFSERIRAIHSDIKNLRTNVNYDVVITNPPFFQNDLKSNDEGRNNALHDSALTLEELLAHINRLLKQDGIFYILLPYHRVDYFKQVANEMNWFCQEEIKVRQSERHAYFRCILQFSHINGVYNPFEINIKTDGQYSVEFKNLLKPFYLHL